MADVVRVDSGRRQTPFAEEQTGVAGTRAGRRSTWLGLLLSAVLVVLLVTQVDLTQSWQTLRGLDPRSVVFPTLLLAAGLLLRPWRWQVIFPPAQRPGFGACFGVWSVANMSNNFLPARGGDILRCFLIARGEKWKQASVALATLGLEKVLDGLALLGVVVLSFWFLTPPGWLQGLTAVAALIFCGALLVMILLHYRPQGVQKVIRLIAIRFRQPALGRKTASLLGSFADGLGAVRSWRQMSTLIVLTALTWLVEMAFVSAAAHALGLSLSLWAGAVVAAILGLGLMIPAAPGYVGSYEFISIAVLGMFGVSSEDALALALLMHAGVLIMTTAFGLAALATTGISLARPRFERPPSETAIKEVMVHGK